MKTLFNSLLLVLHSALTSDKESFTVLWASTRFLFASHSHALQAVQTCQKASTGTRLQYRRISTRQLLPTCFCHGQGRSIWSCGTGPVDNNNSSSHAFLSYFVVCILFYFALISALFFFFIMNPIQLRTTPSFTHTTNLMLTEPADWCHHTALYLYSWIPVGASAILTKLFHSFPHSLYKHMLK